MTERAFKFTRSGARSPFTGFAWPHGAWVEADGDVALCANGIHACRVDALPRWIDDELWCIEVDGVHEEIDGVLVCRRGRLVESIDAWNLEVARELARSCARRALDLAAQQTDATIGALARDVATNAEGPARSGPALAMYGAAHTFELAIADGYHVERRRQAEWLRERLALGD